MVLKALSSSVWQDFREKLCNRKGSRAVGAGETPSVPTKKKKRPGIQLSPLPLLSLSFNTHTHALILLEPTSERQQAQQA